MKGGRDLDSYFASLKLPLVRVDGARQPDLRRRLTEIAFEAEALAADYPDHAAELRFIAGYIRRMV